MKLFTWPHDTLARRFAATTILAVVATLLLFGLFLTFGGVWAQPPGGQPGFGWPRAALVIIEAAPPEMRPSLAAAATADVAAYGSVDWYSTDSSASMALQKAALNSIQSYHEDRLGRKLRTTVAFGPNSHVPVPRGVHYERPEYFLAVQLKDKSWLVFTSLRTWGLTVPQRWALGFIFLILSVASVSAIAAHQLTGPITRLTNAVQRFSLDPQAPPIAETGPKELRQVIATFNTMQAQIRKLVAHRTTMLAAISHDLRTPLTRIRLRGEYIEDEEEQRKLFRDVDEMQAMVDGALAFFRDDAAEEAATAFDLTGVLRTIANDYADQGIDVRFTAPTRTICVGRPFTLKRAFTNLVENSIKYGASPEIGLRCNAGTVVVSIRDRGPGIPPDALERVFNPYYRLETSRNRMTGGVGLGLTAARSIIQEHGGDIVLENRTSGGLEARVTLPVTTNLPTPRYYGGKIPIGH